MKKSVGKNQAQKNIGRVLCDTYLRERLDELPAKELKGNFTRLIQEAQRGKVLEKFTYYNGYYLLSVDGTGCFYRLSS